MTASRLMLLLLYFSGPKEITGPEKEYLGLNKRPDTGASKK